MIPLCRSPRGSLVAERLAEVVETDEVAQRTEPVPVVEAVPGALDDRVEHEHGVQGERRSQEGDRPAS